MNESRIICRSGIYHLDPVIHSESFLSVVQPPVEQGAPLVLGLRVEPHAAFLDGQVEFVVVQRFSSYLF